MHVKPNLRSKLIVGVFAVALGAVGVFYYATTSVISKAFDTVEQNDTRQQTSRVVDTLANRVDQLKTKATDWASWDDTYNFVENHNAAYIESNLQSGSLNNLSIHYMLFFNEKQKLVEGKAVDPDSGADVPVPQGLLDYFKPGSKFLAKDANSESKGLLALPGKQTVKFVALPILTSNSTGPYRGTLVFAAVINQDEVALISSLTHLTVQLYRIDDPSRPSDVQGALGTPTSSKYAVSTPSQSTIVGYQTIADASGKPALVARVEHARDIHAAAVSAIRKFLFIIAFDTLLALGIVVIFTLLLRDRDRTIKLKNEFFSIASHELRTPLTVIRNYAQLMKFKYSSTIKDPGFDHMADSIDNAGAELIGVVNVYLDAARLESGKIPFTPQPFSLHTLAESMGAQLRATAKTKGVEVVMDCPADAPQVLADQERVRQVVLNLFGNAMKFTDSGSITLKCEADTDKMMVYVTDTGRGMDEGAQAKLFQRFKQVQSKDALRGSGLGLFISKKLIEQMGGSIKVESSAPGIGTTIGFSLPLAPLPGQGKAAAKAAPAVPDASAPTSLAAAPVVATPVAAPVPTAPAAAPSTVPAVSTFRPPISHPETTHPPEPREPDDPPEAK